MLVAAWLRVEVARGIPSIVEHIENRTLLFLFKLGLMVLVAAWLRVEVARGIPSIVEHIENHRSFFSN